MNDKKIIRLSKIETVAAPVPEPVKPLTRIQAIKQLYLFRTHGKNFDKNMLAPLFQAMLDYNLIHTLKPWEQSAAQKLIDGGYIK